MGLKNHKTKFKTGRTPLTRPTWQRFEIRFEMERGLCAPAKTNLVGEKYLPETEIHTEKTCNRFTRCFDARLPA